MTTIESRYTSALWYAWGRIDAGEGSGLLDLQDGQRFADEHKAMTHEYLTEERNHLPSIKDSWEKYVERKQAEQEPAVTEYVFDGLATFTARVEADNLLDAMAKVKAMQGFEPAALVTPEDVQITELSWGVNVPEELVFVHDSDEWVSDFRNETKEEESK